MFIPGKPSPGVRDWLRFFLKDGPVGEPLNGSLFLYGRGRDGLVSVIKAVMPERVWLPAFICGSALMPVRSAGFETAFYDIGRNLSPDIKTLSPEKGDLVVAVWFFGMAPAYESFGFNSGVPFVEDCTHLMPPQRPVSFGGGVAAVFSPRKTLPVPDGGIVAVNDRGLIPKMVRIGPARVRWSKMAHMATEGAANILGLNILPLKDMARGETRPDKENRRPEGISQATLNMLRKIDIEAAARKRKANYVRLVKELKGSGGVILPFEELPPGSVPMALPVWCENPRKVAEKMRVRGIEACVWPGSELPPEIDLAMFKGTAEWVRRGLLLPVHQGLKERQLASISREFKKAIGDS